MANIGFNIPQLNAAAPQSPPPAVSPPGVGWLTGATEATPPSRPPPPRRRGDAPAPSETIVASQTKPLATSLRLQLRQKESGSVVHNRRFVISESLEASKKWFEREVQAQIQRGGLFEDPFMPPVDSTIWPDRSSSSARYRWLRPNVST